MLPHRKSSPDFLQEVTKQIKTNQTKQMTWMRVSRRWSVQCDSWLPPFSSDCRASCTARPTLRIYSCFQRGLSPMVMEKDNIRVLSHLNSMHASSNLMLFKLAPTFLSPYTPPHVLKHSTTFGLALRQHDLMATS